MKRKPSSRKKNKDLRRPRKVNWDDAKRAMELRDKMADDAAHEFIKELIK